MDKCIHPSFSSSLSSVTAGKTRRQMVSTRFVSVHLLKRGGTYAHSVQNDRTKGTQKERNVNLRYTYKKERNDEKLAQTGNGSTHSMPGH